MTTATERKEIVHIRKSNPYTYMLPRVCMTTLRAHGQMDILNSGWRACQR